MRVDVMDQQLVFSDGMVRLFHLPVNIVIRLLLVYIIAMDRTLLLVAVIVWTLVLLITVPQLLLHHDPASHPTCGHSCNL